MGSLLVPARLFHSLYCRSYTWDYPVRLIPALDMTFIRPLLESLLSLVAVLLGHKSAALVLVSSPPPFLA